MENIELMIRILPMALWETLYMVFTSAFLGLLFGLPLGILLFITSEGQFWRCPNIEKILGTFTNILRSFPFAILLIALIPITRWIIGTSLGTTASIVPLTVAATPFIARLVEESMRGIGPSLVQASIVMGSTPMQIIQKVLLPEAYPGIIAGVTNAAVNLVGYSAMAGLIGGGGLGTVAIQYGYQRFNTPLMVVTVILLIVIVQAIQWLGDKCVRALLKQRGIL